MVWQGRGSAGCCLAPCQVECEKIFPRVDKAASIPVFFSLVQQSICKEVALGGPQQGHAGEFLLVLQKQLHGARRGTDQNHPGSYDEKTAPSVS